MQNTSQQIEVLQKPVSVLGLSKWPRTQDEEEKCGHEMTDTLLSLLTENQFSGAERDAFLAGNPPADTSKRFAELIIKQAAIYDWKILLSRPVRMMTAQWCEEGGKSLELVRKLGEAIFRRKRVAHGEDTGTIEDPRWYEARPLAVRELRVLLHQFNGEIRQGRHRKPDWKEVCGWFRGKITQSPDAFTWLWPNVDSLLRYLEYIGRSEDLNIHARFHRIANGAGRADNLFIGWGAWSEHVSETTFGQRLAQIGRSKRLRTFIRKPSTA
jgi:hypothetical protein